jgi:DNA topoisomerase-3
MKVVLAEKPSVARDIAGVLGASNRKEGYYEGNEFTVTYAFGHLVTIAEPEEMNQTWARPWTLEQLPMLPAEWKYRVAPKAETQFAIIRKLFTDPATTGIIAATDAGREGEHIFRLIYLLTGSTKPIQRLWISSLTTEAIRDGFRNLRPSKDFDNLAAAASARAQADWVVGLNFTRAYTTINHQLCTIGRVQTPTLALIVERQITIDSFKSTPFYEIIVTFDPGFRATYITPGADPQTRLPDRTAAQSILAAVTPMPSGSVFSVVTEEKKSKAPGLYDLLTLQKDTNKRYGYTAQETLDIAQSLYEEHKLLSYPRTESRHLSTDMVEELPRILSTVLNSEITTQPMRDAFVLATITPGNITADLLRPRLGKSYVDDTKLTDHHAIIPTHKSPPSDLPQQQRNIYQLVALRFLSIFLPPELRDETTAILTIADHSFRARGIVIKDPGWTIVEPKATNQDETEKDSPEDAQRLPQLYQDEHVPKHNAELKEGKTSPPKPYDDSSLLTAMKTAGHELDDKDLAAYMKQTGLGTPATRAAIIERLLVTGYIERKKKQILPTEKGKALIHQVHPDLKDVALTASWEQQLSDIQDGKLPPARFDNDINGFVARILPLAINGAVPIAASAVAGLGPCPMCHTGVVRMGKKSASCSRWKEGCTFTIWKEQHGKQISEAVITELLEKRKTKLIKGFKKKDGNGTYDAHLVLTADFKVRLEFDNNNTNPKAKAAKKQ